MSINNGKIRIELDIDLFDMNSENCDLDLIRDLVTLLKKVNKGIPRKRPASRPKIVIAEEELLEEEK